MFAIKPNRRRVVGVATTSDRNPDSLIWMVGARVLLLAAVLASLTPGVAAAASGNLASTQTLIAAGYTFGRESEEHERTDFLPAPNPQYSPGKPVGTAR